MPNEHYLIVLTGNLREGRNPDQAALILSKAFGIPVEKGKALFNGSPTPLGKKLDRKLAEKICHYLQEAGADCQLKEVLETPQWSLVEKEEIQPEKKETEYESILIERLSPLGRANRSESDKDVIDKNLAQRGSEIPDRNLDSQPQKQKRRRQTKENDEKPLLKEETEQKRSLNIRLLATVAAISLALVLGASYFFLSAYYVEPRHSHSSQIQPLPSAIEDVALNDPALHVSEIALTKHRLSALAQSVRIWMIQFAGGFNTDQVTTPRLQGDMGVSDDDLTDAWGTKMRYQPSKDEFSISSAGPDKAFDTADDLIVRQKR